MTRLVTRNPDESADALAGAMDLSSWAVATRYDDIDANLDRTAAVGVAEKSVFRARERVEAANVDDNIG